MLCPEVFTWHPIEECIKLLNTNKYSRFAPKNKTNESITEDQDKIENIDNVKINLNLNDRQTQLRFIDFCKFLKPDTVQEFNHLVFNYCKLFGKEVSERILINF